MWTWSVVVIACCTVMVLVGCAGLPDSNLAIGRPARGDAPGELLIGWAQADLTPERPVLIAGQTYARVSEGIRDPLTATVLVLESVRDQGLGDRVVLVSCDLLNIQDDLRDGVRERLGHLLPDLDPSVVMLNATHTHTAPNTVIQRRYQPSVPNYVPPAQPYGVEVEVMSARQYVDFASQRIVEAVQSAWQGRVSGGIAFGLGQAVVGHNRQMSYADGRSRMYGKTADPAFSHPEGFEDHGLRLIFTYDRRGRLTGIVVNLACTAQATEHLFQISADFWHETRQELRRRFGTSLFILPQVSAAGDQSSDALLEVRAEARMRKLAGRTERQEIATRIADGVAAVVRLAKQEVNWNPVLKHHVENVEMPRSPVSAEAAEQARQAAAKSRLEYEALLSELDADPAKRHDPHWYVRPSRAYRAWLGRVAVEERMTLQQSSPSFPVELHVVRLGDVALATNPFELYLDYGLQIQSRSRAVQTLLVQLAGPGSYLPTERSVAGGSYGAAAGSTDTGPEGGRKLVEWTVQTINTFWEEPSPHAPER